MGQDPTVEAVYSTTAFCWQKTVSFSETDIGGHGGALYHNQTGSLNTLARLTNVTIGENIAAGNGGGIYNLNQNPEGLLLVNVTLNLNSATLGGGLYNAGQASLLNTILANNTSGIAVIAVGALLPWGTIWTAGTPAGSAPSEILAIQDPLLLALLANGGPTLTYALDTGSPAINAGNNNFPPYTDSLTTDQRLFPRDANFDIGAYEFGAEANRHGRSGDFQDRLPGPRWSLEHLSPIPSL